MMPGTIRAMLKRRLRDADLPSIIFPNLTRFRTMVVTSLLSQGVNDQGQSSTSLATGTRSSTTQNSDELVLLTIAPSGSVGVARDGNCR